MFVWLPNVAAVVGQDQGNIEIISSSGILVVLERDPVLGNLDQDVLNVHLGAGVDDDGLHPEERHPVLFLMGQQEVEQREGRHCLGWDLDGATLYQVPRKVGSFTVIFHKVLQEGDDVEARSKVCVLLGDVALNSPQMIVVGEAVKMDEYLAGECLCLINISKYHLL